MSEKIVYLPTFGKTNNPARCHVPTGVIEINGAVWPFLNDSQREFVLNHERGHRDLFTYSETDADDYALKKMALKKPYSLWNHIENVTSISNNDFERVHNAENQTLRIAAKKGSLKAANLLSLRGYANADGKNSNNSYVLVSVLVLIIFIIILWIKRK
jgi:hypothetical protein